MKKRFFLLLAGITGICTVQAQNEFGVYIGKNASTFENVNEDNPIIRSYPELVSTLGYQIGINYSIDLKHHLNLEFEAGIQKVEADNKGVIFQQDLDNPLFVQQIGTDEAPILTSLEYSSFTFSPLLQYWFNDHFSAFAGPKVETYLSGETSFHTFYHKIKPFKQFNVSLTLGAAVELNNRLSIHIRNNIGTWELKRKQVDSFYELRHLTEFGLAYKLNM